MVRAIWSLALETLFPWPWHPAESFIPLKTGNFIHLETLLPWPTIPDQLALEQGPENLEQGTENLEQGTENLEEGTENLEQGTETWN